MTDSVVFKVKTFARLGTKETWDRGYFWCPGCQRLHAVNIGKNSPPNEPNWNFNGNTNNPTLTPDITTVVETPKDPDDPQTELFICHSQINNGTIQFAKDCTAHQMANKQMPLPPLPDWFL